MSRLIRVAFIVNILLCLLFVYSSYLQWEIFRGINKFGSTIISSTWNPLTVTFVFHNYANGTFSTIQGLFTYPNTPFYAVFRFDNSKLVTFSVN